MKTATPKPAEKSEHKIEETNDQNFQPCGQVYEFDPKRVKPLPDQIRKRFTGIRRLALSIKFIEQTTPAKVRLITGDPDYDAQLIDGERRLRACLLIDRKILAYVDENVTEKNQYEHSVASNFGRQDHDPMEIVNAILRFRADGKKNDQIAQIFGKSVGWVNQYHSLHKLTPEVQQMMVPPDEDEEQENGAGDDGGSQLQVRRPTLPFAVALLLVRLEASVQIETANKIIKQCMSTPAARRLVLNELRETGDSGKRRTRPSEQWQALIQLAEQTKERFGVFMDMKGAEFDQVIRFASVEGRQEVQQALVTLASEITQLAESVSRVTG